MTYQQYKYQYLYNKLDDLIWDSLMKEVYIIQDNIKPRVMKVVLYN